MDRVTVGRMRVDCAIPRDHPNAMAVRTRIGDAAERLPAALGALLAPLAKLGDEIVIIPKLELCFDLDTGLAPEDLARSWAARLAAAVASWLRPEARTTVLRFPDEAHYLARFLVDSTSGRAAQAWYYGRWRGLASLPLATRLRTALVEEPLRGIAALAALSPSELTAVLVALGPREARRVIEATVGEGGGDLDRAAHALAPLVATWLPVAAALPSTWQAALSLAARAPAVVAALDLRAAVALAAALAAMSHHRLRPVAGAAETALFDQAGLPGPSPLLALGSAAREALLGRLGVPGGVESVPTPASWYTRLGGLLLLLPRLAELPLTQLFGSDAGCARLAVLSRAAGHAHRAEVISDPLWRRVCGVAPDVDLAAWLETAPLASLAAALWRRGTGRAQRLRWIATRHGVPLAVVASEPDGDWLAVAPLTPERRAAARAFRAVEIDGVELSAQITTASAHAAARMLSWLAPDPDSRTELALALAAQQVLRAFARRLPGFTESSPRFLYDSFLDFDATILETDDTFHCRVGRPRLAALFGLTGALRGRLPIGDGRALELYPE